MSELIAFAIGLVLGAIGGVLIYRKNLPRIEKARAQAKSLADTFDRAKW